MKRLYYSIVVLIESTDVILPAPTSKELRLAREDSLLYFRKPSVWSWGLEITPDVLKGTVSTDMSSFI